MKDNQASMNNYFDPRRAIIPIVRLNSEGIVSHLLGTGSLLAKARFQSLSQQDKQNEGQRPLKKIATDRRAFRCTEQEIQDSL